MACAAIVIRRRACHVSIAYGGDDGSVSWNDFWQSFFQFYSSPQAPSHGHCFFFDGGRLHLGGSPNAVVPADDARLKQSRCGKQMIGG